MLRIIICTIALLTAGCATTSSRDPSREGPGDPHAAESAPPPLAPLALIAPMPAPATTASLFACPMHPAVVMNHPGKCPICGMNLEPKAGAK